MLIASCEIDRIKSSIQQPARSVNSCNDAVLHQKSLERYSKWTNTLEAKRIQSDNERTRQKEAEEALRQSIDIQEAKLQFEKRRQDISRANQLLFQESDRMKLLHSSMMMSDVLAEREHQVKVKEELQKLERIRDIKYEELAKHNLSRMTLKEETVRLSLLEKKRKVAEEQRAQLLAAKNRRKAEIEANRLEGLLLKERNIQFVQEEEDRKLRDKQALLNAQNETAKAQKYLNEVRAREIESSIKEDIKIQAYALRVDEMSTLRKMKQEEIFQNKQNSRQKLIDAQAEKLALIRDTATDRVDQQCRDAETDQDRLLAAKECGIQKWKQDITDSRNSQKEEKKRAVDAKMKEDEKTAEISKDLFQDMQEQEWEEKQDKRIAEQNVAKDLQRQIAIKKACATSDKKQQSAIVRRAKQAMNAEVKEFQSFGEQALFEYANAGKNVIPIVHALKTFHKNKSH